MKILITFCLLMVPLVRGWTQTEVLQNYVEQGLQNNLALQQEELSLQRSMQLLRQARAAFLPRMSFEASYTLAEGGRIISFPVGDLFNPVYTTLNQLTETQRFPTDLENVNEQFLPNDFHDTRLMIQQSLFNTDIYYGYKAQQKLSKVHQAKRDAYRAELTKEIKTAYFNYLQTLELLSIYDSTQLLLQELLRVNRSLVRNDKATAEIVYDAEFELQDLNAQQQKAWEQSQAARSYFNFLLNRDLSANIMVDSSLTNLPDMPDILPELQANALRSRQEVKQAQQGVQAQQNLLRMHRSQRLPQISLGLMGGFQGFGYTFDQDQDYVLAQFNLSLPLFTGGQTSSRIQEAQLQLNSAQNQLAQLEQQIQLQVINAYHTFESAQVAYQAQEKAVASARKSYEITNAKYRQQQALLVELLESRTRFTNAQLNQVIARYEWLKAAVALEWAAQL